VGTQTKEPRQQATVLKNTKGPGQGDPAVNEEINEAPNKKEADPKERKPSSEADLPGQAEESFSSFGTASFYLGFLLSLH